MELTELDSSTSGIRAQGYGDARISFGFSSDSSITQERTGGRRKMKRYGFMISRDHLVTDLESVNYGARKSSTMESLSD